MLKKIYIELTGPICNCKKYDLRFGFIGTGGALADLLIICDICGTKLTIPHNDNALAICARLDEPYPENNEPEALKTGSRKNDGELDPFFQKLEEEIRKEPPQLPH